MAITPARKTPNYTPFDELQTDVLKLNRLKNQKKQKFMVFKAKLKIKL